MEPMNIEYPKDNFLEKVKELTHNNKALLIFDETITGFRYSIGGAQKLFNVIPDIATFGKGMANGYPLSAVMGTNDIMQKVEEVFFSGTFGGETLSLAAANAVIDKYIEKSVVDHFSIIGIYLLECLNKLIDDNNLNDIFWTSGHPSWSFLHIKEQHKYNSYEIKTFLIQEMFKRGILSLGLHNLSFSHSKKDIDKLISSYAEVLPMIKIHVNNNSLIENIKGEILEPLFKVR